MGNYRSGRWRDYEKKALVEDCLFISADQFVRDGYTPPGRIGRIAVERYGGQTVLRPECSVLPFDDRTTHFVTFGLIIGGQTVPQAVPLAETPARSGGRRTCFECPIEAAAGRCGRRCRRLYLPPGQTSFGCRGCFRLTYRSTQERDPRIERLRRDPDRLMEKCEAFLKTARQVRTDRLDVKRGVRLMRALGLAIDDIRRQLS